jgi:triosephosphate isomerase
VALVIREVEMDSILVAANWKMYKDLNGARAFFQKWNAGEVPAGREAAFFPPFTLMHLVKDLLPAGQSLGGQNCHEEPEGAFTGEISCAQLVDAGCKYVLIGHSERRHVFSESDDRLAKKFKSALKSGLRPVLCVGEKLDQREAGKTLEVVLGQLSSDLGPEPPSSGFDVAYEPVWAIGTGRVASPEDAEDVHSAIINWLDQKRASSGTRVLYGGSVKPDNARGLLAKPSIHGLLVGGASLDPVAFQAILNAGM